MVPLAAAELVTVPVPNTEFEPFPPAVGVAAPAVPPPPTVTVYEVDGATK
jgi:hypothetical protein